MDRLRKIPPLVWLLLVTLACLVPFLNKAYHIDDTLFLRVAQQIQKHPGDFFGFSMNWFGEDKPMIHDFDNPPLTCYYIALIAAVAGWSEWALHAAFLLPALAAAWGIFALARNYCSRPLIAGIVAVLSPAFLISATSVMCDVMLLAFWVWSVALFELAMQKNRWSLYVASGLLAGFAVLTKFTGLALIPLLAAYGFTRQHGFGRWMATAAIPVLFALTYELITYRLYGHGLLLFAAIYSAHDRAFFHMQLPEQTALGLAFAGGSFLSVLFFTPLLWSKRRLLLGLCVLVPACFLLVIVPRLSPLLLPAGHLNWGMFLQCALLTALGLQIMLLAGVDFWQRRDPASFLLTVWILGIFVFAVALNWTINGRSFLPLVPALGILVARRLDARQETQPATPSFHWLAWPAVLSAAAALFLAWVDYRNARGSRIAAENICACPQRTGHAVWFQGHWGFQYYMEKSGAKPMDINATELPSGDLVVLPSHSSNVHQPKMDVTQIDDWEYLSCHFCATMSSRSGAGFYASVVGPLPFVFRRIEPEHFWVMQVK